MKGESSELNLAETMLHIMAKSRLSVITLTKIELLLKKCFRREVMNVVFMTLCPRLSP